MVKLVSAPRLLHLAQVSLRAASEMDRSPHRGYAVSLNLLSTRRISSICTNLLPGMQSRLDCRCLLTQSCCRFLSKRIGFSRLLR